MMDYVAEHQHHGEFAVFTPARVIWRAPFSGAQVVTVQYRLFHKKYCSDYGVVTRTCGTSWSGSARLRLRCWPRPEFRSAPLGVLR
jgi:hypothetical protein